MSLRVNLWEMLTDERRRAAGSGNQHIQRWADVITHLSDSAQVHGQEFSIEPVEEGWLIEVFTCFTMDYDDDGYPVYDDDSPHYYILIPKAGGFPIVSKQWPMDVIDLLAGLEVTPGTEARPRKQPRRP